MKINFPPMKRLFPPKEMGPPGSSFPPSTRADFTIPPQPSKFLNFESPPSRLGGGLFGPPSDIIENNFLTVNAIGLKFSVPS